MTTETDLPPTVHTTVPSPLGDLTLVASEDGLAGLYFAEHRNLPDPAGFGRASPTGVGVVDFDEVEHQLDDVAAPKGARYADMSTVDE